MKRKPKDVRDRKVCGKTYWQTQALVDKAHSLYNKARNQVDYAQEAHCAWWRQHGLALLEQENRERSARDRQAGVDYHESVRKTRHLADADDKARKAWDKRKGKR